MKKINFSDKFGLTEAVLSGRKTMTRRIIKSKNIIARHWNPAFNAGHCYYTDERGKCQLIDDDTDKIIIPRYKVGEVVAIAQKYSEIGIEPFPFCEAGWRNKLFVAAGKMPNHIRITDINAERLQDISDEDCFKEGIEFCYNAKHFYVNYNPTIGSRIWLAETPRKAFAALIDRISGKGTWDSNPWMFVYEFELVD